MNFGELFRLSDAIFFLMSLLAAWEFIVSLADNA